MKDYELESLNAWFASKADSPVESYDYEYAFEHFGELLDDAYKSRECAEQYKQDWYNAKSEFGTAMAKMSEKLRAADAELSRLRRVEEAAKKLVDRSWTLYTRPDGVHTESSINVLKGDWHTMREALEAK